MNTKILCSCFLILQFSLHVHAQQVESEGKPKVNVPMGLYVTPYYNSEGCKVSVGEHSQKLAKADADSILEVATTLAKEKDKLRAEVMYVLAIRLFDLGEKDESVYWFYTAQYRGRLFGSIVDKSKVGGIGSEAFELTHAYQAFNQLAGNTINGYALADLPRLEKTLERVQSENKAIPKFAAIYPNVSFIEQAEWEERNASIAKGLADMVEYMNKNADMIKEQLRKKGNKP